MGMVDARLDGISSVKLAYKDIRTRLPIRHNADLARAAANRGMSIRSYARRAIMAFIAYDLDKDLGELLSDEPAQRLKHEGPQVNRLAEGKGYGSWHIERLGDGPLRD